ncbi:MAG TPA: alpha/beta hydrolase [Ramlibacter sp.]|jgi:thioesterase domain-containing protein|uniref:alpha/beta hydrolase n=1 Tax=Ramlibacter sp. TaxID=1917967 RepID=UPI002D242993|nr:alpha/beta hydrolase [Ramlibacter sp.]HZY19617.1 alpha/beta hydrolase [Ramlibacter sp.]
MATTASLRPAHQAPPLGLLAVEPLRALLDLCAGRFWAPAEPVGDGHPVVVFPGLGGAPFTTSHLRRYLDDAGFSAHCWGRGINTGPDGQFDRWLDGLDYDLRRRHADSGRKVSLVGWSLGGIYARELARRSPDCVRQVITLGTPFAALPGATHAEALYRMLNGDVAQLPRGIRERLRRCPPVPTTSVYSKSDGVVCWRSCLERRSARSESIEVTASHLGMASHPDVLRIVVDRLAQPEDDWRPLHAGASRQGA